MEDSVAHLIQPSQHKAQRFLGAAHEPISELLDKASKKHPYVGHVISEGPAKGRRVIGFVKDETQPVRTYSGRDAAPIIKDQHQALFPGSVSSDVVVTYHPKLRVLERFRLPKTQDSKEKTIRLSSGKMISLR